MGFLSTIMIPHLYGPPESFPSVCLLKNRLEAPPPSSLKTMAYTFMGKKRTPGRTTSPREGCLTILGFRDFRTLAFFVRGT